MISGTTGSPRRALRPRSPPRRSRAPASRRSRGTVMPSRQPRWPSIGLTSCSSASAAPQRLERRRPAASATAASSASLVRQELVQRRVEQADGHRQPGHDLEELDEVGALHRQDLGRARRCRPSASSARIISRIGDDAVGARRTCARCGTGRCPRRRTRRAVRASSGVSALVRTFSRRLRVGPVHQRREVARQLGLDRSAPRRASPRRSAPSMVITSPSRDRVPRRRVKPRSA